MAKNRIGSRIETLVKRANWREAQAAIEKYLKKEPDDHWLWARLSGVNYEQRDYERALETAEKALQLVPDCPLALWSKANALEMLGEPAEALKLYVALFHRGLEELKHPDKDANECWEGRDWTFGLTADCVFRIAGCLAATDDRDQAIHYYHDFIRLLDTKNDIPSIYSRDDARAQINKLVRGRGEYASLMLVNQVMEQMELISARQDASGWWGASTGRSAGSRLAGGGQILPWLASKTSELK